MSLIVGPISGHLLHDVIYTVFNYGYGVLYDYDSGPLVLTEYCIQCLYTVWSLYFTVSAEMISQDKKNNNYHNL